MRITNQDRRFIMSFAWSSKRAEPSRSFADCLKGAWGYFKRSAAHTAKLLARAARSGGLLRLRPINPTYSRKLTAEARIQARIGF